MIPYGRQSISKADVDAVVEVLQSEYLTQGPVVSVFEEAVATFCGVSHAVAVNSATSALHIACLTLELNQGDWLWTSPITFVASANCALFCGAQVDFVDIDPRTYNLCPEALERKLIDAERKGRLPKIIVPTHLGGQPCDMTAIHTLSKRYKFRIIEDASHAIGGRYKKEPIGNCCYSDITVFSFHPVKTITTGEGGMALTRDSVHYQRMVELRSHGITRDPTRMTHDTGGPWYYQQISLGYNYRMTDLQAALGNSQLKRLNCFVARRHQLAKRYNKLLKDLPVTTPWQQPDSDSAWHLYIIRLWTAELKVTHRQVFELLRAQGIGVNVHYIPVHTHPYYQQQGFRAGDFPKSEQYYSEAISLPIYPSLKDEEQDLVVSALKMAIGS